jgi:hypothetical protein
MSPRLRGRVLRGQEDDQRHIAKGSMWARGFNPMLTR